MSEAMQPFEFEKFPRQPLPFGVSRRRLWSALLTEFLVYTGKGEGGSAFKLADLGAWPDEQLASVVPQIVPGTKITIQEGCVWGQPPKTENPAPLFPIDSPALGAFNCMNGSTTLREAALTLEEQIHWPSGQCFAYVRGLFLWLVYVGACLPKG